MKYTHFLFIFISLLFINNFSYSNQTNFSCKITDELENGVKTKNKIYNSLPLYIILNKEIGWINDLPKKKWILKNNDHSNNFLSFFFDKGDFYLFVLKKFYSNSKKKLESEDKITFYKNSGKILFIKYFYNNDEKIFFTSEIRGICSK